MNGCLDECTYMRVRIEARCFPIDVSMIFEEGSFKDINASHDYSILSMLNPFVTVSVLSSFTFKIASRFALNSSAEIGFAL